MVQKLHICEEVYFDQLLECPILLLSFLHTLLLCHILLFLTMDFFNNLKVSNSLDPDQVRRSVGPDMGPSSLQRLKSPLAGDELNTKKNVDTTFWLKLAKISLIWLQLFPSG